MSDRALSETAMLSSLADISLPAGAAGGNLADLAIVTGLAGLAALLVALALRLVSLRRHGQTRAAGSIGAELERLRTLPEDDRRVAFLHLLKARAPERYAVLSPGLYRRTGGPETAELEAEVSRLA